MPLLAGMGLEVFMGTVWYRKEIGSNKPTSSREPKKKHRIPF